MVVDNKAIDLKILWDKCLDFIKDNIPSDLYDAWFQSVVPDRCDEASFTLRVPSTGFYEFFDNKFSKLVCREKTQLFFRIFHNLHWF